MLSEASRREEKCKMKGNFSEMIRQRRMNRVRRSFSNILALNVNQGATATEYAIILALIAGVIIGVVATVGQDVSGLFAAATQGW
jgi:Flp pilus assembly pilin Flp